MALYMPNRLVLICPVTFIQMFLSVKNVIDFLTHTNTKIHLPLMTKRAYYFSDE